MRPGDETVRFTVSLPSRLLEELDRKILRRGYASRSEFVRDLIRETIVSGKWEAGDEEVAGVLTLVYDHHQRDLVGRIVGVQHDHLVNTVCATHVHLDHETCLEAIVLRGRARELLAMAARIGGLRGVKLAELTRASRIPH